MKEYTQTTRFKKLKKEYLKNDKKLFGKLIIQSKKKV